MSQFVFVSFQQEITHLITQMITLARRMICTTKETTDGGIERKANGIGKKKKDEVKKRNIYKHTIKKRGKLGKRWNERLVW